MASPSTTTAQPMLELAASMQEMDLVAHEQGRIATKIAPPVRVAARSGDYGVIPLEQLKKKSKITRAAGSGYNRQEMKFNEASFATKEYGLEEVIDDRERAVYADYFDHDLIVAQRLQHRLLEGLEDAVAELVESGITATSGVSANWDTASADIIGDIDTAIRAVRAAIGTKPDTMIVTWPKFRSMALNTAIVDRVKHWGGQDPNISAMLANANVMARAVGIDRILVADFMENTANQGQAASLGDIWDVDEAVFMKTSSSMDMREPCAVRIFEWLGDGAGADAGMVLEKYRDETIRSDVMRARNEYDVKIVYPEAGYRLTGLNQ